MSTVRAGKFMMRILTYVLVSKEMPSEEASRVFKGITSVEGTDEEFREINRLLERFPVFKKFDLN